MLFFCTHDYYYYWDWPTNGEWLEQCNRTFGFSFLISKDRWDMTYHFLFVCMDVDHLFSDWPNLECWLMQTSGSFGFMLIKLYEVPCTDHKIMQFIILLLILFQNL